MQDAGSVQQPSDPTTAAAVTELNQQQQQAVKQEPAEGFEHLPDHQVSAQQQGQQVKVEQQQPPQQQQPVLLLSLVVCPSTLVGHWAHEVNKYVEPSVLRPLAVSGTPAERAAAVRRLQGPEGYNVVVISYESLRSDIDWAAGVMWDYVILDEGHVIRSTKSKLAQVGAAVDEPYSTWVACGAEANVPGNRTATSCMGARQGDVQGAALKHLCWLLLLLLLAGCQAAAGAAPACAERHAHPEQRAGAVEPV
jgi:hypothetical protein